MRRIAVSVLFLAHALIVSGCGHDSPTAPSKPAKALHFASSFAGGDARSYWFAVVNNDIPTVPVNLMARFDAGCAPSKIRATVVFDSAAVSILNYSEGPFLKQGGAVITTTVTNASANSVTIRSDRPDSLPGATGQDVFLTLNFQPKTAAATGAVSPIQWTDVNAFTASFTDCLTLTRNASLTVQ